MKAIPKFVSLFFIMILLTACNGTSLTQASVVDSPIATDALWSSEIPVDSETPALQATLIPTHYPSIW